VGPARSGRSEQAPATDEIGLDDTQRGFDTRHTTAMPTAQSLPGLDWLYHKAAPQQDKVRCYMVADIAVEVPVGFTSVTVTDVIDCTLPVTVNGKVKLNWLPYAADAELWYQLV
jgi:hypothetical protein